MCVVDWVDVNECIAPAHVALHICTYECCQWGGGGGGGGGRCQPVLEHVHT